MTSPSATQPICCNRFVEDASAETGYPQSLMLRMMQNASRIMARSGTAHLDPRSMSESMRRDLGFVDWSRRDSER